MAPTTDDNQVPLGKPDNDIDDPVIYGGGKNYAAVLAKHRPVTPPNMPVMYSMYLNSIAHFVSRNATGQDFQLNIVSSPFQKTSFIWDEVPCNPPERVPTLLSRV